MLNTENVVFADNVFTANESCMGYHVTFVENFAFDIHNATNYKFRVTQGLIAFEINAFSNDTKAMNSGYICVSIQLVTSQQESLRLRAVFNVKNRHGGWFECNDTWSIVSVSNAQIYKLMCRNVTKFKEAAVHENGQIDGIGIQGSYFIRNQHVITTSQAKFNTKTHTKVNMSYTWTVCNLTLPNSNFANKQLSLLSETCFTNLGVAEFHLSLALDMDDVRNRDGNRTRTEPNFSNRTLVLMIF
jgi:hypothetical protein